MRSKPLLIILFLLSCFALAPNSSCQLNFSGAVSDSTTGPLMAGLVYHTTGFTVPAGQTFTIPANTIVKFNGLTSGCNILGTLNVTASMANPVIFTVIEDDTAGGDTNFDGITSMPSVGSWLGIDIDQNTGGGNLTGLEVRYSGNNNQAAITSRGTSGLVLSQCRFRDYENGAINLDHSGLPIIDGCIFENGDFPGDNIQIQALVGFSNNVAMNNSGFNVWGIDSANLAADLTINANNMMGGAFVLDTGLSIPAPHTLTLNAGVRIKVLSAGTSVNVAGSLVCNGSAGSEVVFTGFSDDSIGGDTNNDGASTGAPGSWRGLSFGINATGSLSHTRIAFGGSSSTAGIDISGAGVCSFSDCQVTDNLAAAVDFSNTTTGAVFTNCQFDRNAQSVTGLRVDDLPNLVNCTATANVSADAIEISNGTLTTNVVIQANNQIAGALKFTSSLVVPAGLSLTLDAGITIKFMLASSTAQVHGTLIANGTAGSPVVFTTIHDDVFGGDTAKDGATTGLPAQIRGINFSSTSTASSLSHTHVRFGGNASVGSIVISSSSPSITDCVVEDGAAMGINLLSTAFPTISNCQIDRCDASIVTNNIESLVGLSGNLASNCLTRNAVLCTDNSVGADLTIIASNLIKNVLVCSTSISIPSTVKLELRAGVILKFSSTSAQLNVSGRLVCGGSPLSPVILTGLADDASGGDTNLDGAATVPSPGLWRGVSLNSGANPIVLNFTVIRYAGNAGVPGLSMNAVDLTMINSAIEFCLDEGIDFGTADISPVICNCRFDNNGRAMERLRMSNLKNMRDNTASGNTVANVGRVTSGAVGVSDVINKRALLGGVLAIDTTITVGLGKSLRVEAGSILKFRNSSQMLQATSGIIEILGTGLEPVIMTTIDDDDFGGDSGLDGLTSGTAGSWRGVNVGSNTLGRVEFLRIRYAGNGSTTAFNQSSPTVAVESIRVEHCLAQGITLGIASGDIDNLVVFNCGSGIDINGVGTNIRHATVTGCTGNGIDASPFLFTGLIQNSISWGNGVNFVGTTAANLFSSNGDAVLAGMNGNLNADPLFLDPSPSVGNLFLDSASPCVGAADFFVSLFVANDHVESTRMADDDLDGASLSDMGAYERAPFFMVFAGRPVIGETMIFAMLGPPAIGNLYVGLLDGLPQYFLPYGMYLAGAVTNVFFEMPISANFGFPLAFPNNPAFVGIPFAVQMVGAPLGNLGVGSFTNVYRGVVQD